MSPSTTTPRTLTQMLRQWDDEALVALLQRRPELAFPTPESFGQLASRATTRQSVHEVLTHLNAFELWVAQQLATAPDESPAPPPLTGADEAQVGSARDQLHQLALLWGENGRLRPVRALVALMADRNEIEAPAAVPPVAGSGSRDTALVDKVAAGSAFEFVRRVDVLVEHCAHSPPRLRRDRELPTREVRNLGTLLDVPAAATRAHLEIAEAAGVLAMAPYGAEQTLLPTATFDAWQSWSLAEQWGLLARTWLRDLESSGPAWLKRLCLDAFGDPADARVLSTDDVKRWVGWQRPLRPVGADRQTAAALEQAAWIGITGLGALASFAATVDTTALDILLPPRVDHILVQADLTAVAPGPLTPAAAQDLTALADVESRGGATVYRFSQESLRRAFGLGWSVSEILEVLTARSRTPIPQPLHYLVNDLDRLTAPMKAPTGDPAATDAAGRARPHRRPQRAAAVTTLPPHEPPDQVEHTTATAIITALRRSDSDEPTLSDLVAAEFGGDSPLQALREAAETGEVVWFGYIDVHGRRGERLVRVVGVDDGRLSARDARSKEALAVAVHRITAAHIVRPRT